ncbi:MAG: hypothetical protein LWW87_05855 [Geobacteraceae bacterium]|nr:hypothetical protein [Geobacteraceae bacterium]
MKNSFVQGVYSLVLSFGLVIIILSGICSADSMSMQFYPMNPKFTYRLTSDNRIILPSPVQIRFSRSDNDLFCSKVVEVGLYTSRTSLVTNNAAPGTSDPFKDLFTSQIAGGATLCNFNFNDTLITLKTSSSMDSGISDLFAEWKNPLADNYYKKRRQQKELILNFTPDKSFKVFIKKNGGTYEWKNPAFISSTVRDRGGIYGIPYEVIVDPIPNTPPQIDSISIFPATIPANGGPLKISVIAADDLGVKTVSVTSGAGTGTSKTFSLTANATPLGKKPDGRLISLWEGTYNADPNSSIYNKKITFAFKAYDEDGAVSGSTGEIRQVEQPGVPDTQAPKIETVLITPQTLPATGGNVTVSVRASDNTGLALLRLDLILPDGQVRPMNMTLASGSGCTNGQCLLGEWRTSWNMWANSSNMPAVYGIRVTAMDVSKNTVNSQLFQLTVAGKPPVSIQAQPSGQTGTHRPYAPSVLPKPLPIR